MAILTTTNEAFGRVAMHATRNALLEAQAAALGLPLINVPLPWPCSNDDYEARMRSRDGPGGGVRRAPHGVRRPVPGRRARLPRGKAETAGGECDLSALGPPDRALAREIIASGIKARLVTVDPRHLDASFAGRTYDESLLADLPDGVDPCGENGEFHTCVTSGPMFSAPIDVTAGEVVLRDGFVFADLIPG